MFKKLFRKIKLSLVKSVIKKTLHKVFIKWIKSFLDKLPLNYRKTVVGVFIALIGIILQAYVSNEYVSTVLNELLNILETFDYTKVSYDNMTALTGIVLTIVGVFHKNLKFVDDKLSKREAVDLPDKPLVFHSNVINPTLLQDAKKCLELDEGRRAFLYEDTVGKFTIGVGYNIEDRGLTNSVIDLLLEKDILNAQNSAEVIFGKDWIKFTHHQKLAIINMIFNLGEAGFKKFHKTIRLLKEGNIKEASQNILTTKWASQVGKRAERVSNLFNNKVVGYNNLKGGKE